MDREWGYGKEKATVQNDGEIFVVPPVGLEPTTCGLRVRCSAN